MTPEEFAAIEARMSAATEGPWIYRDIIGGYHNVTRNAWDVASCGAGDLDPEDGDRDDQAARNAEFIAHAREDIPALLAAVRERDNTIARVRAVGLLGLDEIAQKSIDATVARMQDQLGCTPDDLGPYVMAKIVDSHIEQAELFAGPVLDALRAALDPQETPDGRM